MGEVEFKKIDGTSRGYYALLLFLAVVAAIGLYAYYLKLTRGDIVTNQNNMVIWGLLIIGVVFSIGLSAGALHVFTVLVDAVNIKQFKPFQRMAPLVAALFIIAALIMISMDIGRPERGIYLFRYFNRSSIFSWNAFLYTMYVVLCLLYLIIKMEEKWPTLGKIVGIFAFSWAVLVHSGTGLIVGLIYSRALYHTAVHAALFIASAIASGLGAMIVIILLTMSFTGRYLAPSLIRFLSKIMGATIIVTLFLVTSEVLEKSYEPGMKGAMHYLLSTPLNSAMWTILIFGGFLIPLAIIIYPKTGYSMKWVGFAGIIHVVGIWAERFLVVIPGLCYPREYLPGYEMTSLHTIESSSRIVSYFPNLTEWAMFFGVFALIFLVYAIAIKLFAIVPETTEEMIPLWPKYKCETCGATFKTEVECYEHLEKDHKIEKTSWSKYCKEIGEVVAE